jgi:excinuclease UvrABC helicase subunit UvrB
MDGLKNDERCSASPGSGKTFTIANVIARCRSPR